MEKEKTHYRKAFNSPYLSSDDVDGSAVLTLSRVALEPDKTKRTKDSFNTAYFVEKELRKGEVLKPMILNAGNSKVLKQLSGSLYLEDWAGLAITVFVQSGVRMGRDIVDGLRISPEKPRLTKPDLTPTSPKWKGAVAAYKRDGNFNKIEERALISDANKELIKKEADANGSN